jgi:endonuclease YncB( thermonuclease family)
MGKGEDRIVLRLLTAMALLMGTPAWAANTFVKDGDSIKIDDKEYRLDGIDAPELDQTCLDQNGKQWPCGIEARDWLRELVGDRNVRCLDKGPDPIYSRRNIGVCTIEDEAVSLNERVVREGWALNFEPYAQGRFLLPQQKAQQDRLGMWRGCFVAPYEFRRWLKGKAKLLGSACTQSGNAARDLLFPPDLPMPTGCSIKGKIAARALLTGHRGIYHLEGCGSYQRTKNPNRWFCSEDDAKAAGFRKAFTCGIF